MEFGSRLDDGIALAQFNLIDGEKWKTILLWLFLQLFIIAVNPAFKFPLF